MHRVSAASHLRELKPCSSRGGRCELGYASSSLCVACRVRCARNARRSARDGDRQVGNARNLARVVYIELP
jgi:hypothetical protein